MMTRISKNYSSSSSTRTGGRSESTRIDRTTGNCGRSARPYYYALCAVLLLSSSAEAWTDRGFGMHPAPVNGGHCYTICPPVVFPTGHDPYYDSSYFIYESELHGGPFGVGTMNPYGASLPGRLSAAGGDETHPIAGFWPGVRRPVVPRMNPTATPYPNPYPYGMDLGRGMQSPPQATSNFLELGSKIKAKTTYAHHHSIHPPCYKVCPATDSPTPHQESHGGPFGPDAYYSGTGKSMFSGGHHLGNFRNPHMESYGGPFGPDPYYTYGDHQSRQGNFPRKTWGFSPK